MFIELKNAIVNLSIPRRVCPGSPSRGRKIRSRNRLPCPSAVPFNTVKRKSARRRRKGGAPGYWPRMAVRRVLSPELMELIT